MTSDAPYYVRRAAQEQDAARKSGCMEARRIHESLARSYEQRAHERAMTAAV